MDDAKKLVPKLFPLPLPTEVEENVIDYSADDVVTIRNCALTCRDWLPRSRIHLFSAVRLSTREDVLAFCDFLDSHSDLRVLVRSITMAPEHAEKRPTFLLETFPLALLSRLPRLRGWSLRNNSSHGRRIISYHSVTLRQLRVSSPVTLLDLEFLTFKSPAALLRFITSFTRLKELRFKTIRFDQDGSSDAGESKPKPYGVGKLRLAAVHVENVPGSFLRMLLLLEHMAQSLESLTLTSGQDVDGLAAVLTQLSMLHSLTFDIIEKEDWTMVAKTLDGARIPSLKSLRTNLVSDVGSSSTSVQEQTWDDDLEDLRLWSLCSGISSEITSTVLAMKLESFTVNIQARRVRPMKTTFELMNRFAALCEEGLQPQVVFSRATFLEERPYWPTPSRITMSSDGRWLVWWTSGGILFWKVSDDAPVRSWRVPLLVPTDAISKIIFSPNSRQLLALAPAKAVAYVWDVDRERHITTMICNPITAAWSSRCIVFVTGAGTISTYNSSTYQPNQELTLGYRSFSRSGSNLWAPETCRPGLLFSPDHRWLAVSYPVDGSGYAWTVWRVTEEGDLTRQSLPLEASEILATPNQYSEFATFDKEATRMAFVGHGLKLHVREVATATPLLQIDLAATRTGRVWGNIAFSGDRHLLVVREMEGQVEVWDALTGYFLDLLNLEGEVDKCWRFPLTFSPCGRYLVSSPTHDRSAVLVWHATDGSFVRRIP